MFPTFVMDGDDHAWIKRPCFLNSFFRMERESNGTGGRETCLADVKNGCANLEAIGDLMYSIEPDCIPGDIQRPMLLVAPFEDKAGGLTYDDMAPQRTMTRWNGCHSDLGVI